MPGDYMGRRFNDTDIYKIVEAASYSLVSHPDPALAKQLDALDRDHRESAAAGRLSVSGADDQSGQAGAGHRHRALAVREHRQPRALQLRPSVRSGGRALSGDRRPRVCSTSRSRTRTSWRRRSDPTRRKDAPGHEEVELALVKLYRATKRSRATSISRSSSSTSAACTTTRRRTTRSRAGSSTTIGRTARTTSRSSTSRARRGTPCAATYVYNAMTDIAAMLQGSEVQPRRRSALAGRRLEARVSDGRPGLGRRHRGVWRRLRAAESHGLHRDVRVGRRHPLESPDVPEVRRREVPRRVRADALQRLALGRVGEGRHVLLSESARVGRPQRAQRVLRRRVLSGESRAAARAVAGAHLRDTTATRSSSTSTSTAKPT